MDGGEDARDLSFAGALDGRLDLGHTDREDDLLDVNHTIGEESLDQDLDTTVQHHLVSTELEILLCHADGKTDLE